MKQDVTKNNTENFEENQKKQNRLILSTK